ncbi:RagB/SusD family nutrient uptake outer membrane protein [Puteibacter caeruleilacunae]|nr:RagB/SusD family nutrient uptake outer membrane protein [Puteibacter caeruleilacunae]
MKRIHIISCIILMSLFCGCDNFLDVAPESSIVSNGYWKTIDDIVAYRSGCYDKFRDINNSTYLGEDRGDSFVAGSIGPTSSAWAQELDKDHTLDMTDRYNALYHFNLLYKNATLFEEDNTSLIANIKAEALLMRAHTYFNLIKTFGDVPLILEPFENGITELIGRTEVNKVAEQIVMDINEAIQLFPDDGYDSKNLWSKPAAYALKTDVLLWQKKVLKVSDVSWDDIIGCADQVEASGVGLLDDYAAVFSSSNKNNNELVLTIHFDKDEQHYMYGRNLHSRLSNVAASYNIDKTNASKQTSNSRHVYAPSPEFIEMYAGNEDDIRRKTNVVYALKIIDEISVSVEDWNTGSIEGDSIGLNDDGSVRVVTQFEKLLGGLPVCHKFLGTYFSEEDDVFYEDDIIIYRWADILLLRAEAKAGKGDVDGAVTDLNEVRNRANTGDYSGNMSKQAVEKEILDERWRELFLELKRWHDLFRAHEYGLIDVYQTVPNLNGKTTPLYWPISDDDLRENELLEQTAGYAGI